MSPRQGPALGMTGRRASAKRAAEAAKSLQRFVRQEYWNGLAAGDVVRVAGHAARGRHWRFRAHVTNTSNGAAWVEVALVDGPSPTRRPANVPDDEGAAAVFVEKVRSFDPDLVTPRWRPRGTPRRLRRAGEPAERPAAAPEEAEDRQPSLF